MIHLYNGTVCSCLKEWGSSLYTDIKYNIFKIHFSVKKVKYKTVYRICYLCITVGKVRLYAHIFLYLHKELWKDAEKPGMDQIWGLEVGDSSGVRPLTTCHFVLFDHWATFIH